MTEPADEDDGLSEYERRFVEAYMSEAQGCGQHAVELISESRGHSAAVTACKLLKRPHVQRALRERAEGDPLVLSRIQRLRFLSAMVRGEVQRQVTDKRGKRWVRDVPSMRERLEAVQTLSKICGDFLPPPASDEENRAAGLTIERLFALMQQGGQVQ